PDGVWILPGWTDGPLFVVDSFVDALPVAALGVLLLGVTVRFTQWPAGTHARYARRLLGPREPDARAGRRHEPSARRHQPIAAGRPAAAPAPGRRPPRAP